MKIQKSPTTETDRAGTGLEYVEARFTDVDGEYLTVTLYGCNENIFLHAGCDGVEVTRQDAAELWPLLKRYAETGRLEEEA
jgi:hypothetical protein